jgi:hypothetical protein
MSDLDIELRQRAAKTVKRAFPVLLIPVDKLVDIVIDTYLEGTQK